MAPGGLGRNFRTGASQNGKCSECWPWTGQAVARGWRAARSIVGSLGTPNARRVRQKKVMTKVECLLHGSMLWGECCFVVAVCCMLLARRKLDRPPNCKNFAKELFHKVLSGSVVLCRKYQKMSFGPWLPRPDQKWLTVTGLRDGLMKVLAPSTEVGCVKNVF